MNETIKRIDYNRKLTKPMIKAIDYIGRHRKSDVVPSKTTCPISMYMANKLCRHHFAMWNDKSLILTYRGERVFTALHPHSKWRIE